MLKDWSHAGMRPPGAVARLDLGSQGVALGDWVEVYRAPVWRQTGSTARWFKAQVTGFWEHPLGIGVCVAIHDPKLPKPWTSAVLVRDIRIAGVSFEDPIDVLNPKRSSSGVSFEDPIDVLNPKRSSSINLLTAAKIPQAPEPIAYEEI